LTVQLAHSGPALLLVQAWVVWAALRLEVRPWGDAATPAASCVMQQLPHTQPEQRQLRVPAGWCLYISKTSSPGAPAGAAGFWAASPDSIK